MQSGQAQTKLWRLEFEPEMAKRIEPLMGWSASRDMHAQVAIDFATKEQAVAFAKRHAIPHQVQQPKPAKLHIRAYADNFAYHRQR